MEDELLAELDRIEFADETINNLKKINKELIIEINNLSERIGALE